MKEIYNQLKTTLDLVGYISLSWLYNQPDLDDYIISLS